jgi:hypothetical protein
VIKLWVLCRTIRGFMFISPSFKITQLTILNGATNLLNQTNSTKVTTRDSPTIRVRWFWVYVFNPPFNNISVISCTRAWGQDTATPPPCFLFASVVWCIYRDVVFWLHQSTDVNHVCSMLYRHHLILLLYFVNILFIVTDSCLFHPVSK